MNAVFRSPLPDVEIPALSVYDFLFSSLTDDDRDCVATIDGTTGAELTYGELVGRVDSLAGALAARGIGVGNVVGLFSPNNPEFAIVFHGILRAGATVTTINALSTAEEIAAQLTDSRAVLLFTLSPLLPHATDGATAAGLAADSVVVLDSAEGFESLDDLLAQDAAAPGVSFDPATQLAVLPYSSGTTAAPKGVMLTHRNLVANVAQSAPLIGVDSHDRVLAVLPFFHIYGMTVLLNLAFHRRAALVTMPRFDLVQFLSNIQDNRCTYVFIAPPIALALAKHPLVDQYDLSSIDVVFSGAAPLDGALGAAVAARLGCEVRQGYGMTEMSPVSHAMPDTTAPLSSVGFTIPNMECKLRDPVTGVDIEVPESGVSEAGELLCKGPNIMVGYLGNERATAEAIDAEGFLHTGDIATVSAEGWVTIVDRLKELIKYKGYQVAPAELEAVLLAHPSIADAAVIAAHDADGEEVPKAYVVLQDGAQLDAEAVIDYVAEHVAPHKKVRQVQFIDTIPKSSAGKILRKDLRALEVAR